MTESVQEQSDRDDAHLRSLGIKPELRRTLGFLSNFAIAFSFISVSTGSFGNFGVGIGLGGPAFFWSWPIVILGQTLRRPGLRRAGEPLPGRGLDLPVVEAPVEPDAWLVHRLVLLLGPGRDGHGRRGHRSPFVIDGIHGPSADAFLDSPDPTGITTMFTFVVIVDARRHDSDQRLRRAAPVDPQQHRRRRPRSSGCSSSR